MESNLIQNYDGVACLELTVDFIIHLQINREIYWEGEGVDEVGKEKGTDIVRVKVSHISVIYVLTYSHNQIYDVLIKL